MDIGLTLEGWWIQPILPNFCIYHFCVIGTTDYAHQAKALRQVKIPTNKEKAGAPEEGA